ncbi:hypothetical protein DPMN_193621 [Dreissena polymorpha]|uniref:Uncharacterized protein n=1 Tax=Dreissena polymorpha TaxID=45954 RepID=A0A9D3XYK7_DREPO|nr:hypothetical protein DPMN_193621 [Dreissena polymorpha]
MLLTELVLISATGRLEGECSVWYGMLATAVWLESLSEPVAFGANAQTEVHNRDSSLTGQVVRHRLETGSIAFRASTQTGVRTRDLSLVVQILTSEFKPSLMG